MKKISASITLCLTMLTLSTSAYANTTQACRSQDRWFESEYALNFSQLQNFGIPHVSEKPLHTRLSNLQGQNAESVWAGANINPNLYVATQVKSTDNFTLTQTRRDEVSQLSTHEQYPRMHIYLKKISNQEKASEAHIAYKENIEAVSIWLERASAINLNDGSWHSEMARGSLAFAAATQGKPLSDEDFQKLSDALAKNIATLIAQYHRIPTLNELVELEIQSTVSALNLETWHWPGTLTDSLPLQAGGLGHDIVHIPGSGVVYIKNLLIAVMQYAAGLNRYLWSFTTLDILPLWKYAKEFQSYAADHTYKLFRWLGAGEVPPQQDEELAAHPACTLRDSRDKIIYRLNL